MFVLHNLERISNDNFQDNISYLEYGSGNTKKRVKVAFFSEELASIVGAFIADGHLKCRECLWGNNRKVFHYELVFREGYKSNIEALARWINNTFEIGVKPKKEENHYSIYISNKIIFRYFKNIFGFVSGRKTETVRIPNMFMQAPDNIKIAILKGILMFDGSVSRKTGYVELYSKSKQLIIQVSILLKELKVSPGYVSLNPDKYGRYRIIVRKQEELKKCLDFFEINTEKYNRLKRILERFKR